MQRLLWHPDKITEFWAKKLSIPIKSEHPKLQYDGVDYRMREDTWAKHILQDHFPDYCRYPGFEGSLLCSPENIMNCFRDQNVLEGLALTVAWGRMTRSKGNIYLASIQVIEKTLLECLQLVEDKNSVEDAWKLLVKRFDWGPVITSKCLHFLARSLGYEANPPVPIDNKVIFGEVWPAFKRLINKHGRPSDYPMPGVWWDNSDSWTGYNRYMTAINCWADAKGWTTTQMECTLFQEYYPVE